MAASAQAGNKRERILQAAVIEIAQHGYYQTTISMIARRAGIADGTVYLYFRSKQEILISIFDRTMERFIREGRQQLARKQGALAKLKRIVELHLTLLGDQRDLAVIFQVELRHSLHFMDVLSRSRIREYLEIIAQVVREGQQQGVFYRHLDALLTAKAIFGVLDEITTDWVLSRRNLRLAQKADAVAELIIGGLGRVAGA